MRTHFLAWPLILAMAVWASAQELPRRAPTADAPRGEAFAWESAGGLRYTWTLPTTPSGTPAIIILCHGTGLDYRWGSANHPPGAFRPGDIVVSVDGPSVAVDGSRLFLSEPADAEAMASFIAEMKGAFGSPRVVLYGHSQGSFFVTWFIGEKPDLAQGVVAHASGVWPWTRYTQAAGRTPIAFMHGTNDPVVPYSQSLGGRDWYESQGHPMVQLRRLDRYNHWPNGDRTSECIDWCLGMTTPDPAEALARAEAMLRPKGVDRYAYEAPPWFSGARDVLRRFEGEGPQRFSRLVLDELPKPLKELAAATIEKVEAAGAAHVAALGGRLKAPEDLRLDGGDWLGHLAAVREDFRGVRSVEVFIAAIGYDEALAGHREAGRPIFESWHGQGGPSEKFAAVVRALPECFLLDTLPFGFADTMPGWFSAAEELGIPVESRRQYRYFVMWKNGWDEGRKRYRELWKTWRP